GEIAIGLHAFYPLQLNLTWCPSFEPGHEVRLIGLEDRVRTTGQPCEHRKLRSRWRFEAGAFHVNVDTELRPDTAQFVSDRHADDCLALVDARVCSPDAKRWIVSAVAR
ncbi:MAG: hypothetical protein QOD02_3861, partial [Mycobacterium sp.]|nr:hypothetical protein [Mycobacterium sp.]